VVQSFGRTHRTNQACPPEYVLLSTECAAEKRCAAAIAKRLESLGALTKGDRRAATGEVGLFGISAAVRGLVNAEAQTLATQLDALDSRSWDTTSTVHSRTRAWWDELRAAHADLSFNGAFRDVTTVDGFLDTALLVPLEWQPSLVELLASFKGTARRKGAVAVMGLQKLASAEFKVERSVPLYEAAGNVKVRGRGGGARAWYACARALGASAYRLRARPLAIGQPLARALARNRAALRRNARAVPPLTRRIPRALRTHARPVFHALQPQPSPSWMRAGVGDGRLRRHVHRL
jgi:hypothetical protein